MRRIIAVIGFMAILASLGGCNGLQQADSIQQSNAPTEEPELEIVDVGDFNDIATYGTPEEKEVYADREILLKGIVDSVYATKYDDVLRYKTRSTINYSITISNGEEELAARPNDEVILKVKTGKPLIPTILEPPEVVKITPFEELPPANVWPAEEKAAELEELMTRYDFITAEELAADDRQEALRSIYNNKVMLISAQVEYLDVARLGARITLKGNEKRYIYTDMPSENFDKYNIKLKDRITFKGRIQEIGNTGYQIINPVIYMVTPYEETEQYQIDQMNEAQQKQVLAERQAKLQALEPGYKTESKGLITSVTLDPPEGVVMTVTNDWYLKTPQEKDYFAAEYYKKLSEVSNEMFGHRAYLRIEDESGAEVAVYRLLSEGMKVKR